MITEAPRPPSAALSPLTLPPSALRRGVPTKYQDQLFACTGGLSGRMNSCTLALAASRHPPCARVHPAHVIHKKEAASAVFISVSAYKHAETQSIHTLAASLNRAHHTLSLTSTLTSPLCILGFLLWLATPAAAGTGSDCARRKPRPLSTACNRGRGFTPRASARHLRECSGR